MRLIGLSGKAGAGKDTVAEWLSEQYGLRHYWFSKPLKAAFQAMFGLDYYAMTHEEREQPLPGIGKSTRYILQTLGTEWGRGLIHRDLWLQLANREWEATRASEGVAGMIVSDVRFENEAAWIREAGGELWHIRRPGAGIDGEHVSEAGIKPVGTDRVIENDSTIGALHATAGMVYVVQPRHRHHVASHTLAA